MVVRTILHAALRDARTIPLCEHLWDARGWEQVERLLSMDSVGAKEISRVTDTHGLLIEQAQSLREGLSSPLMILIDFNAHLLFVMLKVLAHINLEPDEICGVILAVLK